MHFLEVFFFGFSFGLCNKVSNTSDYLWSNHRMVTTLRETEGTMETSKGTDLNRGNVIQGRDAKYSVITFYHIINIQYL
jgi:hypothetical protein